MNQLFAVSDRFYCISNYPVFVLYQGGCTINFQASDTGGTLSVEFLSFVVNDCSIELQLSGGSQLVSTLIYPSEFVYIHCDNPN
mgnify:FL=1